MGKNGMDAPARRRGIGRWGSASGTGASVLVAWLVLASPAGALPIVRDVAPYSGASPFESHSPVLNGSCSIRSGSAFAVLLGHLHANASSGRVFAGGSVCTTAGRSHLSTTDGFLGPSFTAGAAGVHQVVYRWQVTWNGSGFSCGRTCNSTIRILVFGNLFDNTTGLWLLGGALAHDKAIPIVDHSIRLGAWSGGASNLTLSMKFFVSLTPGDEYRFYSGLSTFAEARGHSAAFGTPFAIVNVATGSDFASVVSMTLI
ncbi:MAG: hypothetical protein L3K18_07505 [Thermoplasmata archaeon]|nr:hypothetical protein [Thermoplasmata archaeon]